MEQGGVQTGTVPALFSHWSAIPQVVIIRIEIPENQEREGVCTCKPDGSASS